MSDFTFRKNLNHLLRSNVGPLAKDGQGYKLFCFGITLVEVSGRIRRTCEKV